MIKYYKGNLQQETHYYPFGMALQISNVISDANKNLYQTKELTRKAGTNDYNIYNFEARQYDPLLGRFTSLDPMGQFSSGYVGMGNDPANGTDPDGMMWIPMRKTTEKYRTGLEYETQGNKTIQRVVNEWYNEYSTEWLWIDNWGGESSTVGGGSAGPHGGGGGGGGSIENTGNPTVQYSESFQDPTQTQEYQNVLAKVREKLLNEKMGLNPDGRRNQSEPAYAMVVSYLYLKYVQNYPAHYDFSFTDFSWVTLPSAALVN